MLKEFIIIIFILILVIIGNIVTINYTKETISIMQEELDQEKEELMKNNEQEIKTKIKKIEEEWGARKKLLSYYLEHDELEKIEAEITTLRANIETEEYENGVEALQKCNFLLEHVKDKEAIKLDNIF